MMGSKAITNILRGRQDARGFTLVELAIVLSISALLFGGLWKLVSGGGQQLQGQASADLHRQIMAAVEIYMGTDGQAQGFVASTAVPANTVITLQLPPPRAAGTPCGGNTNIPPTFGPVGIDALCPYLPDTINSNTVNAYDQGFAIGVRKEANGSYSYMVMTTGGQPISDSEGGSISALIGAEGGFMYNVATCGATPNNACGAYGAWTAPVANYGLGGQASVGRVASMSYVGRITTISSNPWLARVADATTTNAGTVGTSNTPDFFTLQRSVFFKSDAATAVTVPADPANTYNLHMVGNTLRLEGGAIDGATYDAAGNPTPAGTMVNMLRGRFKNPSANVVLSNVPGSDDFKPLVVDGAGGNACIIDAIAEATTPQCVEALQVFGSQRITGSLVAMRVYAGTLYQYGTSDLRVKHSVKPLEGVLDRMGKLVPISYVLNGDKPSDKQLGLIAQDLKKVYPELVKSGADGYMAVNYIGLIGPLVGAVNELKTRNDELSRTVREQSEAIERLEGRIGNGSH